MKIDTDEVFRVGKSIAGTLIIAAPIMWFASRPYVDSYIQSVYAGDVGRIEQRISALERQLAATERAKQADKEAQQQLIAQIKALREALARQ